MRASIHRPTYISVNLTAIAHNIAAVVAGLPKGTRVFSVVKANAYGHGVEKIAPFLEPKVDGFCVSNLDEALELRELGITKEILVMGIVPVQTLAIAIEKKITVTVTNQEWIDQLEDGSQLTVHIKVDSGMGRVGFRGGKSVQTAIQCLEEKGVQVEGIYTHFATADQVNQHQFHQQLTEFKNILASLENLPAVVHASNSAASIWHSEAAFNMVRLGDIQYGLNPSGRALSLPFTPQPALTLYSELVQVKTLSEGEAIGYGATYQTSQEENIGTVPIGYADGLTRDLQGMTVLVDGQFCPIIGRVSMDQITIRLPKLYPIGTQVTLIGKDKELEIGIQDWADYRQTINYEIVCLLSDRIPRYHEE